MLQKLVDSIEKKKINVAVVGLGYVGLPLALRFVEVGFKTYGVELNEDRVNQLNSRSSYISDINNEKLSSLIDSKLFFPTIDFEHIKNCSVIVLCVPTPLDEKRSPDLSFIKNSMALVSPFLSEGQVISLESTTYPGTTEEIIMPYILNKKQLKIGDNFFLVYSPERIDPGNKNYKINEIPKVVGGVTPECTMIGEKFYSTSFNSVITVSSTKVAEMSKLLENIHRSVNISLVNEMKMISDKMNIDIREVIDAASSKPFGFTPYYPGPGLGGHCIPVDPLYLTWKANQLGIEANFIETSNKINLEMPHWIINKIKEYFFINQTNKKENYNILVIGVAYKKDISDTRESPALEIIKYLLMNNFSVDYSDPFVEEIRISKESKDKLKSVEINAKNLLKYDAALITTDHSDVDYELVYENSKVIFDTRGIYRYKSQKVIQC